MKAFVILLILGVAGYFGYRHFTTDDTAAPDVIENPVYADIRVDIKVPGRELQVALFGRMASQADCELRSALVWGKMILGCKECMQQSSTCRNVLEPRYERLFANTPIYSTYASFTRGSPQERDGRMVIFGLTADEGDALCEQVVQNFRPNYSGRIECIPARRD